MGKKAKFIIATILLLLTLIIVALLSPVHSTPADKEAQTFPDSYSSSTSVYPPTRPEQVEGGGYLGNPYNSSGKLRTPDRCVRDTKICPNGKSVTRDPKLYCQFSPCGS